jgi:hypothetical protein
VLKKYLVLLQEISIFLQKLDFFMSTTTLIKNAIVINEGKSISHDILIKNGRIERIDEQHFT